jgi:hypothetical protein
MKNNFWGLIWSSFNEIQGVLLGLLGFLGGIALIRYRKFGLKPRRFTTAFLDL